MSRDMKPETPTCDRQIIASFLRGELSADEQIALEAHLSDCKSCCAVLRETAAERELWEKASLYLRDDIGELSPLAGLSTNPDGAHDQRIASQVLNTLAPTDDPQMLGRIDGYEISGVIGCGGMGAVLKGFDRSLNRVVAIKVMSPHLATSGAARKRFAREAQAAAAITHDNVIDIYGVAEANDLPYLVMPYARGTNLQKRIDQRGPLPLIEVLRIGHQIALGLAAAHQQGLVHRDIKPANILLSDGIDRLVITDFGLARAVDDASVTRTGVIAGTPQYMSPEQARGEPIDHRSDLFSLGSVLYTLCTARVPFRADSAYGMLRRITDNQPRPIREINAEIPSWLCQVISKLHAKSPEDRYQTAGQVADVLKQCLVHVQTENAPLPAELQTELPRWTIRKFAYFAAGSLAITAIMLIANSGFKDQRPAKPNAKTAAGSDVVTDSGETSLAEDVDTAWYDSFAPSIDDVQTQSALIAAETHEFFAKPRFENFNDSVDTPRNE